MKSFAERRKSRARECRKLALLMTEEQTRTDFLQLASSYEALASAEEALEPACLDVVCHNAAEVIAARTPIAHQTRPVHPQLQTPKQALSQHDEPNVLSRRPQVEAALSSVGSAASEGLLRTAECSSPTG